MAYINANNFDWKDDIEELDKPLWLDVIRAKIEKGTKSYRDLYIDDNWAFLAPDNYGAEEVEDIEVSVDTQVQQASREFGKVRKNMLNHFVWACQEADKLDIIDSTAGWRLRDFISESWYQSEQCDKETEHRAFVMWRRVVNVGSQILTEDMVCVQEHLSKYDKL